MKFFIKCENDNVQSLYLNHSTYNPGDSGLDLFIINDAVIKPKETKLIDLGIACQLKSLEFCFWNWTKNKSIWKYHSYMLFPRSSISKSPLQLANSIGLVDSSYVGNIKAALYNNSDSEFKLNRGERYVQLVRPDLGSVSFELVDYLRNTQRGSGGFGSTHV
jgi:dUTP pyrophosphatase